LKTVLDAAARHNASCEKGKVIGSVYFHVQISNTQAVEFYKSAGFEIIETKKDYYKDIEPRDCFILSKAL
jgi:ribosomal protein S18 acetylase RimI-like enzyme